MSWIFGAIPKARLNETKLLSIINSKIEFKYYSDKIIIYAGGLDSNLHCFENNSSKKSGWVVSGIGINSINGSSKILEQNDWEELLEKRNFDNEFENMDGHFVAISWDVNFVKIHSDILGLRDIYIGENENGIFFSTNVVWLSKIIDLEIDFNEFSSRWLLFNQISSKSIFKGIERIVAGRSAIINLTGNLNVKHKDYNWLPSSKENKYGVEEYSSRLNSLINLSLPPKTHLSLSLSGGMDSRVILSYLLKNKTDSFDTHTFGDPNHPDSKIAQDIAKRFGIKHEQFNQGLSEITKSIDDISEYTSQTLVNNAASSIIQLQNYSFLKGRNVVLVDGGFGEIWRREFFYKLYLQGRNALIDGDINKITPYLMLPRADIFNNETSELMSWGIAEQLTELFAKLPVIKKDNVGNWLDIFAIKTRLTNYYSHEQARLDNLLTGVMPFLQPSVMSNLFNMPTRLRQNGKLFRKIINSNSPELKKFELAKGLSTHPYFFNSLQSRIWGIAKKRIGLSKYQNNNSHILLNSLKEYVCDILNSRNVKETSYYDYIKVKNIVERYYNGDSSYSNELDWWLSFELFRKSIFNEKDKIDLSH